MADSGSMKHIGSRLVASMILFWITLLQGGGVTYGAPEYLIGTGKSDITGPAADVNMMGYAMPQQLVSGIHTRLYARAFLFADKNETTRRFVFVNLDACMASQGVAQEVFRKLEEKYDGMYSDQNVILSGTHTHAGPGGYLTYLLYQVTSLGFVRQSFDALVDGIVEAVSHAHDSVAPGDAYIAQGDLVDGSINRSPTAYLNNPTEERAKYKYDTDKTMTLMKVVDEGGRVRGSANWYAVHGTSMSNKNQLISGDNKGVASQLMEKWASKNSSSAVPDFISAFCQSNVGDTSPNTEGAFCLDTGLPCDMFTSTCNGRNELCWGRGPGWPDDVSSTHIIAERQSNKAIELLQEANEKLTGAIQYGHMYINMDYMKVKGSKYTSAGITCPPAMGFSFAAGTTDGPGAFDFKQGDTKGTAFWRTVRDFIRQPSKQLTECQFPKPILLATGECNFPYTWQPHIVDISIARAGQLVILAVPGEFTTMAGRRLRAAVKEYVAPVWGEVTPVIAGLSNTYSSYITTREEYQMQRYEGGSTLYGPHTLDAYIQEFLTLADSLMNGTAPPSRPGPPNLLNSQWSLLPGVLTDAVPLGSFFGAVVRDISSGGYQEGDTVQVVFQSACPRNNIRRNDTFLAVETMAESGAWEQVYTDNDWSTKFLWGRPFPLSPESTATVNWTIPEGTPPGLYRISHFGSHRNLLGHITEFNGSSSAFRVAAKGKLPSRGVINALVNTVNTAVNSIVKRISTSSHGRSASLKPMSSSSMNLNLKNTSSMNLNLKNTSGGGAGSGHWRRGSAVKSAGAPQGRNMTVTQRMMTVTQRM